ncbi:MAG: tail fiber protein [Thalassolituus sp.]
MSEPFIGEVRIWGCGFTPRGWASCDGQLLPIASNATLFSLLGTTYGGDGRTTFALPDLRDRAAMHPGHGPGLTSRRIGEKTGVDEVTLTEAQMPAHKLVMSGVQDPATAATPAYNLMMAFDTLAGGTENILYLNNAETANAAMATSTLSTMGGSQAHENRQPAITLNYCIALVGLYPSRG